MKSRIVRRYGNQRRNKGESTIIRADVKKGIYMITPSTMPSDPGKKPRTMEFTDVYRNLETGYFYVHPYVMGPVSWTQFGEPTVIAPEDFSSRIAGAVLANLEKFGKEKFDRARAVRRGPSEQRQFLKQHLGVSVQRVESGGLVVRPLHRERGGMVGSDEDRILLSVDDLPGKLADAIAEALKRAT